MPVRISKNRVALENIPLNLSAAAINEARSNIAQHATTMDLWAAAVGNVLDGTGVALTITAIANAPQAGASRDFYPIVATVLTHGATFDIDGAVNRTAAAGEVWTFVAKTVNTYRVFVRKADGTAVAAAPAPVFGRVVRTAGNLTTSSVSLVDLTDASITLTTGARPVHVSFTGSAFNDTAGAVIFFNVDIDGTKLLGTEGLYIREISGSYSLSVGLNVDSAVLTAGSHTIKIQWYVSSGTGLVRASSANPYVFSVHEIT
mgnify:FL=1